MNLVTHWMTVFSLLTHWDAHSQAPDPQADCTTHATSTLRVLLTCLRTQTQTQIHTHVGFYGLRELSIGVMVFILYKLYVLLPYTYPTPKLSPHRRRCIYIFPQKTHSVWFISVLNYGDTENVLINHLLLVIPMSYPCHYTNLCPHKPHKHAHTHTHRS